MTRLLHHSAAICAALFITIASMGAVVTVPPPQSVTVSAPILA